MRLAYHELLAEYKDSQKTFNGAFDEDDGDFHFSFATALVTAVVIRTWVREDRCQWDTLVFVVLVCCDACVMRSEGDVGIWGDDEFDIIIITELIVSMMSISTISYQIEDVIFRRLKAQNLLLITSVRSGLAINCFRIEQQIYDTSGIQASCSRTLS